MKRFFNPYGLYGSSRQFQPVYDRKIASHQNGTTEIDLLRYIKIEILLIVRLRGHKQKTWIKMAFDFFCLCPLSLTSSSILITAY